MEKLISGVHRFRKQYWSENQDLFRRLAEHGQSPEALFIACCDSRVIPTVITHTNPGDLFIFRNMGNFVPPYSENPLDGTGIAAAIEYAVLHLHVRDIIICGHSDCGAMKALYKDRKDFGGTPHIVEWLKNGERTLEVIAAHYPKMSKEERLAVTSEENVLVQMENLRTYPVVQRAAREGRLHVHAWFFEIGTGKVFRYSPDKGQYEPIHFEEG
ncbi:MAG TPA: carbonic anhydrase [Candidatus Deferrimicrobiaceae bacterium]|nr:carbonic anhydrase [Candidatus Deferrimicrobiaceae bacterium]